MKEEGGYKVQLSLKAGAHMLNLRADTVNELTMMVDEASKVKDLDGFFADKKKKEEEDPKKAALVEQLLGYQKKEEEEVEETAPPSLAELKEKLQGDVPLSGATLDPLEIARARMRGEKK